MNRRTLWTTAVNLVAGAVSILVSNTEFNWFLLPISMAVYFITIGMFYEQLRNEAMKHGETSGAATR